MDKYNDIYTYIDPLKSKICFFKLISNKYFNTKNEIHFGCAKKYEEDAQCNDSFQSDRYEGAIAVLRRENPKLKKFKRIYNDIYEIYDGDRVILKRKSSLYLPIYCFYCADASDSRKIDLSREGNKGIVTYHLEPDSKIFDDFKESGQSLLLYIFNLTFFYQKMKKELSKLGKCGRLLSYDISYYTMDENGEWICPQYKHFDPKTHYYELLYKRIQFEYQKERRFVYIDDTVSEKDYKWTIFNMPELTDNGYATIDSDIYIKINQPIYITNEQDYQELSENIALFNQGIIKT